MHLSNLAARIVNRWHTMWANVWATREERLKIFILSSAIAAVLLLAGVVLVVPDPPTYAFFVLLASNLSAALFFKKLPMRSHPLACWAGLAVLAVVLPFFSFWNQNVVLMSVLMGSGVLALLTRELAEPAPTPA